MTIATPYRHWCFRENRFHPDGYRAAVVIDNQFFVNGKPIPNDLVHGVRTVFGFGYLEIYVCDSKGNYQLNARGDDAVSLRLWGRISLRPALPDERWENTHRLGPAKCGVNPPATTPKPPIGALAQNPRSPNAAGTE